LHARLTAALIRLEANRELIRAFESRLSVDEAARDALESDLDETRDALEAQREFAEALRDRLQSESEAFRDRLQSEAEALRDRLQSESEALRDRLRSEAAAREDLGGEVTAQATSQALARERAEARVGQLERTLGRLKSASAQQAQRLSLLLQEARRRMPEPFDEEQLRSFAEESRRQLDDLLVAFEDEFRGSPDEVKERLHVYLPYLEEARVGTPDDPILDLGCGRGEWLELVAEEGLSARGVDINRSLVRDCVQRKLDVVEGDVLDHLASVPDGALGAITGFHILEHLSLDAIIGVLDEAVRVLRPGGLAIFETPNPGNVLVGSHTFYFDPTHRSPLPARSLEFLAEARGLCQVEIMHLNPYPESDLIRQHPNDELVERFNSLFFGARDYAVIGRKG
jgi:O-antigen chain-terminating methyltransferase